MLGHLWLWTVLASPERLGGGLWVGEHRWHGDIPQAFKQMWHYHTNNTIRIPPISKGKAMKTGGNLRVLQMWPPEMTPVHLWPNPPPFSPSTELPKSNQGKETAHHTWLTDIPMCVSNLVEMLTIGSLECPRTLDFSLNFAKQNFLQGPFCKLES